MTILLLLDQVSWLVIFIGPINFKAWTSRLMISRLINDFAHPFFFLLVVIHSIFCVHHVSNLSIKRFSYIQRKRSEPTLM